MKKTEVPAKIKSIRNEIIKRIELSPFTSPLSKKGINELKESIDLILMRRIM